MSIAPIVTPAHNADGIPLMPAITALYPFALDEGSVNAINCFLVKKTTTLGSNQTVPVGIKISIDRRDTILDSIVSTIDHGDDVLFGQKYRTKILITPATQLEAHTEYSVILSKDLSKVSVFDIKAQLSNTGTKSPLVKGPYTGLINDTYRIDILIGGTENTAKYKLVRLSDNYTLDNLTTKKRFIDLDQGLNVKFDIGTYVAGDSFSIVVKPQVKTNEIYSWDFKTSDNLYVQPSDANSNVIVGLPVESATPVVTPAVFQLTSVKPTLNSLMNNPGRKAEALIQDITFKSYYRTDAFNNYKIKLILDNGNPLSVSLVGTDFIISFTDTTTKIEVVDLVNGAGLKITASVPVERQGQTLVANVAGIALLNGKRGGEVVFTFNKNIKATSFDVEKIQLLAESTVDTFYGTLDFDYEIINNKLIINLL